MGYILYFFENFINLSHYMYIIHVILIINREKNYKIGIKTNTL